MEDFIHLHVHTQYSVLDGMASIPKLVDKARANGMRGMALTDHGNMMGIKDFFDYVNKVNKPVKGAIKDLTKKIKSAETDQEKADLQAELDEQKKKLFIPIFGCEMYCARRGDMRLKEGKIDHSGWHLIVLAKNEVGYRNLVKLVSHAWVDGYYMRPRTDHTELEKYHEGLIICSACLGGEIPKKILANDIKGAEESILWFKKIWGDDYYIELQRHEVKNPMQRANRETYELQKQCNPVLIELARKHDVKLICSNDSHFVDEEDAEAHDHLLCLSTGKDLDDPTRMLYTKQEWFKTREEMNEIFADVPDALSNTCEILDKVSTYDIESDPIMPFYPIPADFGTEEHWRKVFTEESLFKEFTSDENGQNPLSEGDGQKKIDKLGGYDKLYRIKFEADYLGKLAYEGASRLYGNGYQVIQSDHALQPDELSEWAASQGIRKEVDERIRFELHIMKTMGFPGYFLIVQDFINSARNELGVWVGPGRGSAAGSVVAYCLGITKLDPLKYDLLFERFLNPDRISLPDIDTDFDDDGRGKVLQWVMDKYGHENCAHIITYGTMAAKNSIKDVGRVEKVPLSVVNAWCKAMPDRLPDGMKPKLVNYLKCTPELQKAEASPDIHESNTIRYAKVLEGTVRSTGIHACGFIICRDPISDHVPVSTADDPDFPNIKTAVTQYDGHVIESTGLIKMDFLGLKTLSEMKEACRVIKEAHNVDIDLDTLPIDDELTYQLYQSGRTVGTFQFESAGMQKYLKELHPTVFEDLIAMNALYRPGPMDYIPSFIARKNGREEIKYDIPVMEQYLKDTYGITVYQEQVMLLSRLLADFTRGESDALRKAMGKKKKDIVDQMKPKFIEGGKKNGHDPKILEKIWGDWEKFASYAFNKSHAACYSWVAYQTAYLKAHYPAEFMAALLTRRKNDIKEVTKLLDECQALKIEVLGPDVNESHAKFGVNDKQQIRFGLKAIKGLGEAAVDSIVEEREKNGMFKSIFDFMERVNLSVCNKKSLECLALSGGFDCFGLMREQYLCPVNKDETFLDQLVRYGIRFQADKAQNTMSLFGDMDMIEIAHPQPVSCEPWNDLERLNKEKELVGMYLSAHPLDEYEIILKEVCNTRMSDLDDKASLAGRDLTFGGIVTNVREGRTKNGNPMGIVKIEDYEGSGEIAFFGEDWARVCGMLRVENSVFVTARCEPRKYNESIFDLRVAKVEFLADIKDKVIEKLTLTLPGDAITEEQVEELSSAIESHPGNVELFVAFQDSQHSQVLFSTSAKINVQPSFINTLRSIPGCEFKIN
ncbi:MAG: DNA polymerase III subunit alpha [Bacteroidales bacterium]|nr:DNA polymerase III subunit alpha [Bacteroidales bacterium]